MRLHHRMIDAEHGEAVERDVLDELLEGAVHRLESAVEVEMLGIDVGDDGDGRRQLGEGAVASSASTTIQSPAPSRALVP